MFASSAFDRLGGKDLRRCVDLFTASDQRQVALARLGALAAAQLGTRAEPYQH